MISRFVCWAFRHVLLADATGLHCKRCGESQTLYFYQMPKTHPGKAFFYLFGYRFLQKAPFAMTIKGWEVINA